MPHNIVTLFSAGHSGSTLLSLMIGAHSAAMYTGELHALPSWIHYNRICGCGTVVKECSFWKEINRAHYQQHGVDFFKLPKSLKIYETFDRTKGRKILRKLVRGLSFYTITKPQYYPLDALTKIYWSSIVKNTFSLYNTISTVSGASVLVDSTKSYIRSHQMYRHSPEKIKIVFLIRDGRAVCHSYQRRGVLRFEDAAKIWKKTYMRGQLTQKKIPTENKLMIKYEDLCTHPSRCSAEICNFLKIDHEKGMIDISKGISHSIAGNDMKWNNSSRIQLNEKWKRDLSEKELIHFETIAGDMNRRFGYPHYKEL